MGGKPLNVGLHWTNERFHSKKPPRLAVVVPSGMMHAEPVTCEIDCTAPRLERSDCRRAPALLAGLPSCATLRRDDRFVRRFQPRDYG